MTTELRLTRRDFLKAAEALAIVGGFIYLVDACRRLRIELPTFTVPTETPPSEVVPPVTFPATEISPSPSGSETIVIVEQRYMSQQEVLTIDPLVKSRFQEFQAEIRANNSSATFAAWGAFATAQTGETYFTPFFEVYDNGNLVGEYVNIGKIDGSIATLELKSEEVMGPDGKIYASLSQTVNADTNKSLEAPLPYIWIPYSRAEYQALPDDEKGMVPVYFSAIPGIVPQNEVPVHGGVNTENIKMIIATPTPTPEAPAIPGTEIIPHYTETINASDTEYNIPVTIITDEKMVNANPMMTIDKIYANDDPDFRTRYGETAKEAIAHAVAYAEYQCWQKNDPDNVAKRAGVSFDAYWKMVREAQEGKRDWSEVEFQTWANDLTTPEYDAIKRTFRPGNLVTIAYVRSYSNTMVGLFDGEIYFGTEVDANGNLAIFIGGYPIMASLEGAIVNSTNTVLFAEALDRLSWESQGAKLTSDDYWKGASPKGSYNSNIFYLLSKESNPPNGWRDRFKNWDWTPNWYETALAITPNDEAELFSQP